MSLRPDDRSGWSRSKSNDRSSSTRGHSKGRAPSPGPSYTAITAEPRYGSATTYDQQSPDLPGSFEDRSNVAHYQVSDSQPAVAMPHASQSMNPYERLNAITSNSTSTGGFTMGDFSDLPPEQRTAAAAAYAQSASGQYKTVSTTPYNQNSQSARVVAPYPTDYNASNYQYAAPPDKITYTAKPQTVPQSHQTAAQQYAAQYSAHYAQYAAQYHAQQQTQQAAAQPSEEKKKKKKSKGVTEQQPQQLQEQYHHYQPQAQYPQQARLVEPGPSAGLVSQFMEPSSPPGRSHSLSVSRTRQDGLGGNLSSKMHRLSVSGNRPEPPSMPGQFPPASPLLEAYHGTYQSISPFPSPLLLAEDDVDSLPPLTPVTSTSTDRSRRKGAKSKKTELVKAEPVPEQKKRVKIYDAEDDALALVDALTSSKLDADALIDILPALTHDQMLELRSEYKKHCKVQGRGINLAKHIKMKTSGNFGKICYVTALGRWESEGYWANFWYQSNSARRELLIEALMGRSNAEVRAIKESFKDKRYGDSLTKCMDKELKVDKFRMAVLLALEEKKQEENEVWPIEYRNRDVDTLYTALKRREGGESVILQLVITRSDNHLREVLRTYERKYQENFARDALKKSNNLVGEVIAHILNGVINRPARDAMLLHHGLEDLRDTPETKADRHERQERHELLASRLVRLHWDRMHLTKVKHEYRDKYRQFLEQDVEDATRGDFGEFCLALCET